jgi:hypothetical protein
MRRLRIIGAGLVTLAALLGLDQGTGTAAGTAPPTAPVFTSAPTATRTVGHPAVIDVRATGTPEPTLTEQGALPGGLTFGPEAGGKATISGTPTAPGTVSFVITATSPDGAVVQQAFTLMVDSVPAFTSPDDILLTAGQPGSLAVTTTGSPAPTVSEEGTLPAGLAFQPGAGGTATVSGTPTTPGHFIFHLLAINGAAGRATQKVTVVVDRAPAFTSPATAALTVGTGATITIAASGNPAPIIAEQGGLPAGLTFLAGPAGRATIKGTPTAPGTYGLVLTATNGSAAPATQSFSLVVRQIPDFSTPARGTMTAGRPGTLHLAATGSPTPVLRLDGTLPTGVAFEPGGEGTATLSGTPEVIGTFPLTVVAVNGEQPAPTQPYQLVVIRAPSHTTLQVRPPQAGTARVTLVARVSSPGLTPTGTVTFADGPTHLGTVALGAPGSNTEGAITATLQVTLTAGHHDLTARFAPAAGSVLARSASPSEVEVVAAGSHGLATGAIIAIAAGVVVLAGLVVGLLIRRRRAGGATST